MCWKPLLEGDLLERARDSVLEIASELEPSTVDETGPTFSGGLAGVALFYGYLAAAHEDGRAAELAVNRMGQAIDAVGQSNGQLPSGFYNGLSGIAWTGQHLSELLVGESDPEMNAGVDELLAEILQSTPWRWEFDLIYGLAGIACYALDHPNRQTADGILSLIVERLDELSVEREGEIAWWTSPNLMIPRTANKYPNGYYNLGLSHGAPGVIGSLARICAAGISEGRARSLLQGAVAWLLGNRRPEDGGSCFSYFDCDTQDARSAWCYGDPGIAAVLFAAADLADEPAWREEGLSIAKRDCARPFEATGVVDAEICHGAAGLGHLYNRLYQATGEELFAETARSWFKKTLAFRNPGQGIGGFLNWWPEAGEWHAEPGLLTGSAGIGLALLAATSSIEPNWDRPMHLGLKPRAS